MAAEAAKEFVNYSVRLTTQEREMLDKVSEKHQRKAGDVLRMLLRIEAQRLGVADMQHAAGSFSVYTLSDPRTDEVRYVGVTQNHVMRRLGQHLVSQVRGPKKEWLDELASLGLVPIVGIVETGMGDGLEAERKWIAHFRSAGASLTNTEILSNADEVMRRMRDGQSVYTYKNSPGTAYCGHYCIPHNIIFSLRHLLDRYDEGDKEYYTLKHQQPCEPSHE